MKTKKAEEKLSIKEWMKVQKKEQQWENPAYIDNEPLEEIIEQYHVYASRFSPSVTQQEKDIKNLIFDEYKKGNIVILAHDGLQIAPIKEIVKQPTEGLLYDLNRDEMTILTFLNDPKWINDYASSKVIGELKKVGEKTSGGIEKIHELSKYDSNHDNMMYNIQSIHKITTELLDNPQ